MKSIKKNILKIKYKRLFICKFKIKNLITKSIFFNRNINVNYRAYSYLILNQKKYINNKYYNICKFSGYSKSINNFCGFGRHELNRKAILGQLQNIKLNSW